MFRVTCRHHRPSLLISRASSNQTNNITKLISLFALPNYHFYGRHRLSTREEKKHFTLQILYWFESLCSHTSGTILTFQPIKCSLFFLLLSLPFLCCFQRFWENKINFQTTEKHFTRINAQDKDRSRLIEYSQRLYSSIFPLARRKLTWTREEREKENTKRFHA